MALTYVLIHPENGQILIPQPGISRHRVALQTKEAEGVESVADGDDDDGLIDDEILGRDVGRVAQSE